MSLIQSQAGSLLELLPKEVLDQLEQAGRRVRYDNGQLIQQRGMETPGISIVLSGQVLAGNMGLDGSFVITSVLQAGDCFGEFTLFADLPRTQDLSAVENTEILQISEKRFNPIFNREPALARALLHITLRRTHELVEFLDGQRRLSLEVRISMILLAAPTENEVITCRQEELAYLLGVTRVSIARALKRLKDKGFLYVGYGQVGLLDKTGLAEWVKAESALAPISGIPSARGNNNRQ